MFVDGWCGNGYAITSWNGPFWSTWSWTGYCLSENFRGFAWDVYPSWIHALFEHSVGNWTPWGCITFGSISAPVRIAANLYWDGYDDWGF